MIAFGVLNYCFKNVTDILIGFSTGYAYLYKPELLPKVLVVAGIHHSIRLINNSCIRYNKSPSIGICVNAIISAGTLQISFLANNVAQDTSESLLSTSMRLLSIGFCYSASLNTILICSEITLRYYIERFLSPYKAMITSFVRNIRLNIVNDPLFIVGGVEGQITLTDNINNLINNLINNREQIYSYIQHMENTSINIDQVNRLAPLRCKGLGNSIEENCPENCAVCMETFNPDTLHRMLGCNHGFHATCIDEWLKAHMACPLCRYELIESTT